MEGTGPHRAELRIKMGYKNIAKLFTLLVSKRTVAELAPCASLDDVCALHCKKIIFEITQ